MQRNFVLHAVAITATLMMFACSSERVPDAPKSAETPATRTANEPIEQLTYTILATLPHDRAAFTQGLVVDGGEFLESTGQVGQSTLRRVDIASGKVVKLIALDANVFGEGMAVIGNEVFVLTWLNQRGFVFDRRTLQQIRTFSYSGEGWGLASDGRELFMSNGTNMITVHDPTTFGVRRSIPVTLSGRPIGELNELEWIDGMLWANVWRTDNIVRIDPASGKVTAVLDLTGLLPYGERTIDTDVLNGIAWDGANKALYVTGKNWPHVFHIAVKKK